LQPRNAGRGEHAAPPLPAAARLLLSGDTMPAVRTRRLDWIGAAAGLALALFDTWLLTVFGVEMRAGQVDAAPIVALTFAINLTILGWLAGGLAMANARARADAETIRSQQAALAVSQRAAFENEKLAAIGRLAAGIAHEVRNPLGVIRASAAMVRGHFAPGDDSHRACGFILDEIDRLDGLIASLLAFARPTALRVRPAALDQVVARAAALADETLRKRDAKLVAEIAAPAPELPMDPDLIAQVLLGLVTNAAEAVAPGGCVALRARVEPEVVVVAVADDGPGVPEADRTRVFEPFYTTKASGTGLGLAMAERIARAHGGELRVVQGAGAGPGGRGACFELVLPATRAAA
jgi:two-component system sensor histidine kinase HydH